MDQTTHEIRLANWTAIIEQCQARPTDQTAKQWLAENNIPEKQYYYWLRRVRKAALGENQTTPATGNKQLPAVPFYEIPAQDVLQNGGIPAVTIKTKKSTIEISSAVPEALMIELVKAVSHAL